MALPIEEYALIGDTQTAALVGADGSIDWLCLPRFDSPACFAALLGGAGHGRWSIAPVGGHRPAGRAYRGDTLVLESLVDTAEGRVRLVDCMPPRDRTPDVVRRVEGVSGRVRMSSEVVLRFDYGHVVPWLRRDGRRLSALAGPDAVVVDGDVAHEPSADGCAGHTPSADGHVGHQPSADGAAVAQFDITAGQRVEFRLAWSAAHLSPPGQLDVGRAIAATEGLWRDWAGRCGYRGRYRDAVVRSLVTLKAMAYSPTGGIVAAPTTSLPEQLGGVRNWDYRYCWIRDATFTLLALLEAGYRDEAVAWREWLLRAVAGRPEQMQIMYGVDGARRLTELELSWLPGYAGSAPVRIGNAASGQFQLDVYGELMDALHQARAQGVPPEESAWQVQRELLDFLESHWRDPDEGIWEVRGPRRHFTHSKVMAWAGVDRAVKAVRRFGLPGPADDWARLRQAIHDDVCRHGYDPAANTFTQYYGSSTVDAALLLMAPVGFLPATDERIRGTVGAVENRLCHDGLLRRYEHDAEVDGLPAGEGAFLPCTFWLADNHILAGDVERGRAVFERLLALRNDVGLLSEEYDPTARRLVGNFPQALSHIALVNTALDLVSTHGPAQRRADTGPERDPV